MPEANEPPIPGAPRAVLPEDIAADLARLGVAPGTTLLVHSAPRRLGDVTGEAHTVLEGFLQALGPTGTLMVPTHSAQLSDPSRWVDPPVAASDWPRVRASLPAWDPARTPTRNMGRFAEYVRTQPDAIRSDHPKGSFAAIGPQAGFLTSGHRPGEIFGESSPLGRLYALDGNVLLLGVGHGNNTSLHLAEARTHRSGPMVDDGYPARVDGRHCWIACREIDHDDGDFDALGAAFEAETGQVRRGRVACAEARLMPQRALVDFAVDWLDRMRGQA